MQCVVLEKISILIRKANRQNILCKQNAVPTTFQSLTFHIKCVQKRKAEIKTDKQRQRRETETYKKQQREKRDE